ncbi:hypothetical protein ACNPQK_14965 [Acinetobacter guillouiae]|uniref:hypothetical protein n=1 Tax=Acinetobacter guillouiae TaxID=106649 RepID=UPI003AF60DFC
MMTLTEAETVIHKELLRIAVKEDLIVEMPNKPQINGKPFQAPTKKAWSKAYIQYAHSNIVGIGNEPCVRDFGAISIQCFAPKGTGLVVLSTLCDKWRRYLQSFRVGGLEVYLVHAPQDMDDDNFYAKIVRAEFRVN